MILVLNAGSSSLKYALYQGETRLTQGIIEHLGETPEATHGWALTQMQQRLINEQHLVSFDQLRAIGHRVVHGGEAFVLPTRIDGDNLAQLQALHHLAPLHNPHNVAAIEAFRSAYPALPQVAVFDTAFHATLPPHAYRYALPQELYSHHGIRKYGFHGTSHQYVAQTFAQAVNKPLSSLNLISFHLGNGASACAIAQGQSVDTTMGFTPLAGLVMGTRSGDLDPALVLHLQHLGYSIKEVENLLNKQSGLKGLCGDADLRNILQRQQAGDAQARLALDVMIYHLRLTLGSYAYILGRVDGIIFTGGIGEHAPWVRQALLQNPGYLPIKLDEARNAQFDGLGVLSCPDSEIAVWEVPTNEELAIARAAAQLLDS